MKKIKLKSPGKVNLHLAVGEKRDDGFHELDSIFAALDFADTLVFSLLPGNDGQTLITTREDGPFLKLLQKGQRFVSIPAEKNTVFLASELFRRKTGIKTNLSVELIKRIPPGSGLGGGSSNAAAAILALNGLFGNPEKTLSGKEMLEMAAQLGCDVPFFVEIALTAPKSPARNVSGRGELFKLLPAPPDWGVLLAFPGFSSNTAAAYCLLDNKRPELTKQTSANSLKSGEFSWNCTENWDFYNDFQELFIAYGTDLEKNAYKTMLADIKSAGAAYAGLSGSGSACFGIFSGPEEAKRAEKKLDGVFYELKSTFFLRDN